MADMFEWVQPIRESKNTIVHPTVTEFKGHKSMKTKTNLTPSGVSIFG